MLGRPEGTWRSGVHEEGKREWASQPGRAPAGDAQGAWMPLPGPIPAQVSSQDSKSLLFFISGGTEISVSVSHSVVTNSLQHYGLQPTRLLSPWNLQTRMLEWVTITFSRGSSQPRDQTWGSCIAGRFFTTEPPRKPY